MSCMHSLGLIVTGWTDNWKNKGSLNTALDEGPQKGRGGTGQHPRRADWDSTAGQLPFPAGEPLGLRGDQHLGVECGIFLNKIQAYAKV